MKLTANETKLLESFISGSAFNGDKLDLTKSWNEQLLECEDYWMEIADIKSYASLLNTDKNGARGVLGSLTKKGIIGVTPDEVNGEPFWWVTINEDGFNKLKEAFAQPKAETKPQPKKTTKAPKATKTTENWNWFHAPTKSDAMAFQIKRALESGRTKESLMEEFKSLGVQWNEDSNAGINWMRACMAMKEYLFKLA